MATQIKPQGKRVVVRPQEPETKIGGILLPESAQKKPLQGTVCAVASGLEGISLNETVIYGQYSGTEVEIDGEKLIIIDADEIYGVIEK